MPTMAAAPFPYKFPAHGLALLVIDMQRDFLEPGGFGEALGNNHKCLLVEDATASYFPALKASHPGAVVSSTVLFPRATRHPSMTHIYISSVWASHGYDACSGRRVQVSARRCADSVDL